MLDRSDGERTMTEEKHCPRCKEFKPKTPDHWYFFAPRPGKPPQTRGYCKSCQIDASSRRSAESTQMTAEKAISEYRENRISTTDLFRALACEMGDREAQKIVDQERERFKLPPMVIWEE